MRWGRWCCWQLGRLARAASAGTARRVALLLSLVGMVVMAGLAWRTEQHALQRQQLALARLRLVTPMVPMVPMVKEPSALGQFEAGLLARQELAPLLQDLLERGQTLGLAMRQGQYREQVERAGGFVRHHLSLPAVGQAEQVTRFIEQALQAHPALALVSAQLARERMSDTRIEARLEWVVMAWPDDAQVAP